MKILGKKPTGRRLERILSSPNFKDGTFQNIRPTPQLREGASILSISINFFIKKKPADVKPSKLVPSVRTDLVQLADQDPTLIWFGHSSYLIKYHGKNILVDPVFSGHASPIRPFVKAFEGTDIYTANDIPFIDLLIITHDHYDHLDYQTVMALKDKVGHIYTTLGVGEHLESWGYDAAKITEFDWWQSEKFSDQIKVTATPARHFSGRAFERSTTLWASFVLELDHYKIFIGGDSGYDDQFQVIGQKFGPFDIAMVECGQYNPDWPYIHMFPEQTAQVGIDLKTKVLFPVHWGKFILSDHPWTDSIERVLKAAKLYNLKLASPKIGEPIILHKSIPNSQWWQE